MSSLPRRPETVTRLIDLMSAFPADWALCGGWTVDAWLGRQTRDHLDIDLVVFEEEQRAVFEYFEGWQMLGHDDNVPGATEEQWDGRRLDLPAHMHVRKDDFDLDIQLNERSSGEWVFSRQPRITLPLTRCIGPSNWGLPVVGPEVILYYKAIPPGWRGEQRPPRAHDDADLEAMLPHLEPAQVAWLAEAIEAVRPGHRWLDRL
jgi:hypothetical protein